MPKKLKNSSPCLAHVQDGDRHGVAAELHVLVMPAAEGGFFAQGIEIDYVATGATEQEVRDHFANGFIATVLAYLKRGRDLKGLFKSVAPIEVRQAYFASKDRPVLRCAIAHKDDASLPDDVPHVLNFIQAESLVHA